MKITTMRSLFSELTKNIDFINIKKFLKSKNFKKYVFEGILILSTSYKSYYAIIDYLK